ncbi:MAG: ribosome maturation factor RimM [Chitinophagales bacterium]
MELINIGKTGKTHGFKGHLKVYIDEFYMSDFQNIQAIFIDNLPYFIKTKDINSDTQAIIFLEDIDTKEKAQKLQSKPIFVNEENLTEVLEDEPYNDIVGYEIVDTTLGKIGKIEQIVEMPQQFLAQLKKDKKEILIPLNDDFIIDIDDEKQEVEMQLPDGFLEIF